MKLTEWLAIYGALLSTFVLIWNIRKAIPSFKVDLVHGTDKILDKTTDGIFISVKNTSSQKIYLTSVSLLIQTNTESFINNLKHRFKYSFFSRTAGWAFICLNDFDIDNKCPKLIEPWDSHNIFIPEEKLNLIFRNTKNKHLKASAQDKLWRSKYSTILNFA